MKYECPFCKREHKAQVRKCRCGYPQRGYIIPRQGKPGSELTELIPKFFHKKGCGCKAYARRMDNWGVKGCEARYNSIKEHLLNQAKQYKILHLGERITDSVINMLLTKAIRRAKRRTEIDPLKGVQWAIMVTSAPRKDPTLNQCLQSLTNCGWDPIVVAEPGTEVPNNYKTIYNETQLGIWHNWRNAIDIALSTDAEYIVTIQDDSLFHPDSKAFIESFIWPYDTGFISLYTPKHYSYTHNKYLRPKGINRVETGSLWGACALAFPRQILEDLRHTEVWNIWKGANKRRGVQETKDEYTERSERYLQKKVQLPHTIANSDTAIGKMMNKLKKGMYFVDPSPVRHIAKYSTISHGTNIGKRNCYRCAHHKVPLSKQVPIRE